MSGLELLGAIASSIALVQAVKGTLKAVDFLRQNSDMKRECNNLRKEVRQHQLSERTVIDTIADPHD
jgi:hypothetical protein